MDGSARSPEHLVRCLAPVAYQGGDERLLFELDGVQKAVSLKISGLTRELVTALPDLARDLIEVAALVYAVDAAVSRGGLTDRGMGRAWHRAFRIEMPVRAIDTWTAPRVRDALEETLMFLSGDRFTFAFRSSVAPSAESGFFTFSAEDGWRADRVILFSGGLDSFAGALEEIVEHRSKVALVSHSSSTKIAPVQRLLVQAISEKLGHQTCRHFPVRVQLASGTNREGTHRTRSFLFAVLGLITAMAFERDRISFHENGVVNLNLPPVGNVLGTRATRTTHPKTLDLFTRLFGRVRKRPFRVDNPFAWRSKREVVEAIARLGMADRIRDTTSCADTHNRTIQHPHCGRCSQCIDRRFAVLAAGLAVQEPAEAYAVDLINGQRDKVQDREMALSYLRNALAFEAMSPADLLELFPSVSDALDHIGEPPPTSLNRIADLLKRHGAGVAGAMRDVMAGRSVDDFPIGSLPRMFGDLQRAQALGLPSVLPSNPAAGPSKICLEFDRCRMTLSVDGVQMLGRGATFDLLDELATMHLAAAGRGLDPLDYPLIPSRRLAAALNLSSDEALRKRVNRARGLLKRKFEGAGFVPERGASLIDNIPWHGYRLAPDQVDVRLVEEK